MSGPSDQRTLLRTKSCLKCQKLGPYEVKGAFSKPVCARKQTNCPPGIDEGFSTGSCNRRHELSARAVYPATSPCPTLSASEEPIFKLAPTDNMGPKSDTKRRHRLLKS